MDGRQEIVVEKVHTVASKKNSDASSCGTVAHHLWDVWEKPSERPTPQTSVTMLRATDGPVRMHALQVHMTLSLYRQWYISAMYVLCCFDWLHSVGHS